MKLFEMGLSLTLAATLAVADTHSFRNIIGDAANIQMDAETLAQSLNSKRVDDSQVRADSAALAKHIAALRADVDSLDASLQDLTPDQRKDWELAKTKVQLLQIFSDLKQMELETNDAVKSRRFLLNHAKAIAVRASLLQRTVNRLDR
jgi:hypothetical protein